MRHPDEVQTEYLYLIGVVIYLYTGLYTILLKPIQPASQQGCGRLTITQLDIACELLQRLQAPGRALRGNVFLPEGQIDSGKGVKDQRCMVLPLRNVMPR